MLLENRNAIVFGVANKRSIAWAITQALNREGARIALTDRGRLLLDHILGRIALTDLKVSAVA